MTRNRAKRLLGLEGFTRKHAFSYKLYVTGDTSKPVWRDLTQPGVYASLLHAEDAESPQKKTYSSERQSQRRCCLHLDRLDHSERQSARVAGACSRGQRRHKESVGAMRDRESYYLSISPHEKPSPSGGPNSESVHKHSLKAKTVTKLLRGHAQGGRKMEYHGNPRA